MALDREKTLEAAQRYVDRKRYDKAIAEYQRVVQADPTDARTLLKIGDLQSRTGAYADAVATYDQVGKYYATNGFALKAIAVYKQIRELIERHVPQLAERYGHILPRLAEIYTELGLVSDALAAYDEVATRLQKGGRDREAIDVFRKMVALDPGNPLPPLRHAEACIRATDVDAAVASFWNAAQILVGMQRADDALKVLERLMHFRMEPRYALPAAQLYLRRGTPQDGMQALAKLQICFQASPRDLATLELLAEAFTAIGQGSKSVEVRKEMARIAYEIGDQERHQAVVAQLLEIAPADEQVIALAELKPRPKTMPPDPIVEVEEIEEIEELDIDEAEEIIEADFDDIDVAEVAAERVEIPARTLQSVRAALADAESFRSLRLYDKARDALRLALRESPSSTEVREKLRDVLAESGDRRGALAEMLNLARLFWEQGDSARSRRELEEIIEVAPDHVEARQLLAALNSGKGAAEALNSYDVEGEGVGRALSTLPPAEDIEITVSSIPPDPESIPEELEEVLAEASFFVSRELYEDARYVLLDQLERTPGHPLVMRKLEAIEAKLGIALGEHDLQPVASEALDDDTFAIAASLDAVAMDVAPGGAADVQQVDVDEVFAKFKEGVRAQISEADSSTHYDLAVAYKEMGLSTDAISEFELAARDPAFECTCHAMIGMVHAESGALDEARRSFETALEAKRKTADQRLSLYYDIGDVCEKLGAAQDALEYFRKAVKMNASYRDASKRVAALQKALGDGSTVREREDYDDVDAAFDRLMDTK